MEIKPNYVRPDRVDERQKEILRVETKGPRDRRTNYNRYHSLIRPIEKGRGIRFRILNAFAAIATRRYFCFMPMAMADGTWNIHAPDRLLQVYRGKPALGI